MAVAWPLVRARLAAALPTVLGSSVTVYNGKPVTGDRPDAYITIGHQPSTEDETAGSYDTDQAGVGGFLAAETGEIMCEIAAVSGDSVVPDAFTIASALHSWVQADQTLGVMSQGSTSSLSVEVLEQNAAGAVQRLLLTLTYTTRV